jgi:hypothetical protein
MMIIISTTLAQKVWQSHLDMICSQIPESAFDFKLR